MKSTFNPKKLIKYVVFLALVAVAVLGLEQFFNSRPSATYTAPLKPVVTIVPKEGEIKKSFQVSGYVEADAMIPVVPFVSGTITEYPIKAGDVVEKDQVIAEIDKDIYYNQKSQAEAAFNGLDAAFKRIESLYEIGAASQQDYDTLKAQRDAAEAQLKNAEIQLGYSQVKAPVSGTVLMAPSAKGSVGTTTQPLAVIADLSELKVSLNVPERYFDIVTSRQGDLEIEVSRDNGKIQTKGILKSVGTYIDPTSKTFKVEFELEDPSLFRPGMFIKAKITYEKHEGLMTLPQSIRRSDGGVFYIDGDKAVYMALDPEIYDDERFACPEGYENTKFLSEGQTVVLDGERVNPKDGE